MSANDSIACLQCNITFSNKWNLRRHQEKIHALYKSDANFTQVCNACGVKCRTIVDLYKHIQKQHTDIELQFHEKIFYCQSDFDEWKAKIERKSVSSFVLASSNYDQEDVVIRHYRCHRSGNPVLKKESEKKRKVTRVIKTGVTCPARIKTTMQTLDGATEIRVEYQSTHLGHECELSKLPLLLQKEIKSNSSVELSAGNPTIVILEQTKDLNTSTKLLNLTSKQDVAVDRDFLVSDVSREEDAISSNVILCEMTYEEYNDPCELNTVETVNELSCAGDFAIDGQEVQVTQNEEINAIPKQKPKKRKLTDLENEKSIINGYLQIISEKVEPLECVEDLRYVKNELKNIHAYLEAKEVLDLHTADILVSDFSHEKNNSQRKLKIKPEPK